MAPTIFRSTDASAPALNGNAGSLVNVLDWCLDTGTNAGALGWGIAYTGTNARSYRAASGVRHYLDVDDNAPDGTALGRNARVRGYETMTALATGTNLFPTAAQVTTAVGIVKSTATGATARPWILIGDAKTFYFFCESAGTDPPNLTSHTWTSAFYFGEILSGLTGDGYRSIIAFQDVSSTVVTAGMQAYGTIVVTGTTAARQFMPRTYTGAGSAIWVNSLGHFLNSAATLDVGNFTFPNSVDGGLYLNAVNVYERGSGASAVAASGNAGIRGRLRGCYQTLYNTTGYNDQDTFTGVGDFAGKTFIAIKCAGGMIAFETTTWDASS